MSDEALRIMSKYPTRIPIIVNKYKYSNLQLIFIFLKNQKNIISHVTSGFI